MSTDDQNKSPYAVFIGVDEPTGKRSELPIAHFEGRKEENQNSNNETPVAPSNTFGPQSDVPELVSQMQSVQTQGPMAELNKTTMDDNNGGRITFNEDKVMPKTIKGVEDPNRLPIKKI